MNSMSLFILIILKPQKPKKRRKKVERNELLFLFLRDKRRRKDYCNTLRKEGVLVNSEGKRVRLII